ncbi:hypothetical protein [Actinophytocola sp.]|uniref:sunset domain-containing protein n=1 Tax=Actinophytocola sp. TaxID=1872138 RepID=UPI002D730083|nr:hypothetical protein [Actinophytocola sp.]HYQ62282.1 hypothetical protein [Actinophytocola sp.]
MPIFGQVWLWSSAAFLLGALLCWLLVARPARNRVGELEAQLTTRTRRAAVPERLPEPDREDSMVPGLGDDEDFRTRAYRLQGTPPPPLPPERGRLAPYTDPESPSREFAPMPPELVVPQEGREPAPVEQPSSAATQYLDVSSGSLAAPPEVPAMSPPPSDRGWFDDELEGDEANQAPEEQAAVPRNRHQLIEDPEPYDGHQDDGDDDIFEDVFGDEPRPAVEEESGGTVFTQRTHPIPGELIRRIDEAGQQDLSHVDNLADNLVEPPGEPGFERTAEPEASAPSGTYPEPSVFTEPERSQPSFAEPGPAGFTEPAPAAFSEPERSTPTFTEPGFTEPELVSGFTESERSLSRHSGSEPGVTEPEAERNGFAEPEPAAAAFTEPESSQPVVPPEAPVEQTEVVSTVVPVEEKKATRTASDLPKRVPQPNRISQTVSVRVEPTPMALPKRVPGKPRHQVPFGVEASSAAESVATVTDEPPEAARSLFEPIVPAEDEGMATPPPPHRLRQGSGGGRGPFGPGSAMPLPGGASPSPEFTIKASVAALRYCTPESPQFGRTVAEVWFRSAADAERVGFRPVG